MKKHNNSDDLFSLINWIYKKIQLIKEDLNPPSSFILNRWLSMGSKDSAIIINNTFNYWNNKNILFNNSLDMSKFLRIVMPTVKNKFFYIKKPILNKTENESKEMESKARECSRREIMINKSLLALLQTLNK